jgi:hypothetical protein
MRATHGLRLRLESTRFSSRESAFVQVSGFSASALLKVTHFTHTWMQQPFADGELAPNIRVKGMRSLA